MEGTELIGWFISGIAFVSFIYGPELMVKVIKGDEYFDRFVQIAMFLKGIERIDTPVGFRYRDKSTKSFVKSVIVQRTAKTLITFVLTGTRASVLSVYIAVLTIAF